MQSVPEQTQCLEGTENSPSEWTLHPAARYYVAGMLLLIQTAQLDTHIRRCS